MERPSRTLKVKRVRSKDIRNDFEIIKKGLNFLIAEGVLEYHHYINVNYIRIKDKGKAMVSDIDEFGFLNWK
jgi:hypothetical protein